MFRRELTVQERLSAIVWRSDSPVSSFRRIKRRLMKVLCVRALLDSRKNRIERIEIAGSIFQRVIIISGLFLSIVGSAPV